MRLFQAALDTSLDSPLLCRPLNSCPGQSAEMCWRIFVVLNLEDFPGDFPGGFFWALFPTKMRRKNPARKSAKKSGGSKIKIREKSVLPKAGPNNSRFALHGLRALEDLSLMFFVSFRLWARRAQSGRQDLTHNTTAGGKNCHGRDELPRTL